MGARRLGGKDFNDARMRASRAPAARADLLPVDGKLGNLSTDPSCPMFLNTCVSFDIPPRRNSLKMVNTILGVLIKAS